MPLRRRKGFHILANALKPTRGSGFTNSSMIEHHLLTSMIRYSDARLSGTRQGVVRPLARIFGGVTAGGRAP
jgi:hypothetical protein